MGKSSQTIPVSDNDRKWLCITLPLHLSQSGGSLTCYSAVSYWTNYQQTRSPTCIILEKFQLVRTTSMNLLTSHHHCHLQMSTTCQACHPLTSDAIAPGPSSICTWEELESQSNCRALYVWIHNPYNKFYSAQNHKLKYAELSFIHLQLS